MSARIVNPFKGKRVGWTWADHKAHGKEGGTDYIVAPGKAVTAAADGIAHPAWDGLNGVTIVLPDGRSITSRENASIYGHLPRAVKIGQRIATSGRLGSLWPHIDAAVHGVRVPFEPLVHEPAAVPKASRSKIKAVAAYLNRRGLGMKSAASSTGIPGPVFWRMVQTAGRRDGIYPAPYRITGVPGPKTSAVLRHYENKVG